MSHSEADLAKLGICIELKVEPDDEQIEGNLCATDDPEADAEQVREVSKRLSRGDVWAWCYVVVTATWTAPGGTTYTGSDSIGGCSYASEADFRRDGYFADLVDGAVSDLSRSIAERVAAGRKAATDLLSFPIPENG